MAKFTLCLSDEAASRIDSLVTPYGGSVPGYAAAFASALSRLPTADQEEIRLLIQSKIRRLEEAALRDAPRIPAAPTPPPSEAATLLAQAELPPPPDHQRRARPGRRSLSTPSPVSVA